MPFVEGGKSLQLPGKRQMRDNATVKPDKTIMW